ncbi:hypothetical protein SAMN04489735_10645 [Aneurinibacillus thermoaerophilus]|jgi:hypothetical protein|uniref:CxxH/CxxC protein, BA_5709 family n=1 Tax=Aneurinibacillus thermoaerophilus TaxID=143495 RepID=A0A1G8FEH9_ANETH|nr:hypothetical protein SAMN04489735_10645 [Aneurinibacillus thermoaerophilus]
MITVCQEHMKDGLNLLNVPHVEEITQQYLEHRCIFCNKLAKFELFYVKPMKISLSR